MTDQNSQGPQHSEHVFMVPTSPQYANFQQLDPYRCHAGVQPRTNPWAIASYSLAILAFLLAAVVSPLASLACSLLAMLCGAMALATQLVSRRRMQGVWMALLAIAASAVPLLLTAVTLFLR